MEILNLFDLKYEEVEEHLDKKKKDKKEADHSSESAGEEKRET